MDLLTLGGFAFIIMIAIFFGFVMGFVSKHNDSDSKHNDSDSKHNDGE